MAIIPSKFRKGSDPTPELPYGGSLVNAIDKAGNTTPIPKEWWLDVFGFLQSLLVEGAVVPNGQPDNVINQQYVGALSNIATAIAQAEIAAATVGFLQYEGAYNATTNTPDLTSGAGILQGYSYAVTVGHASNFHGVELEAGDMLIAEQDTPTAPGHWTILQTNLTPDLIKTQYESNANTNAYTDAAQTIVNYLTVTAATDLDQMRTDVSNNNAKVSADGSVTTHNDVTDAGSGAIITLLERSKLDGIEPLAEVNPDLISQALAEGGTDTDEYIWSSLRVRQAIDAYGATPDFVAAKEIFVDPNGNDTTGTGGKENPFQTLTEAISHINLQIPGPSITNKFVVKMAAGDYTEAQITVPRGTSIIGVPGATKITASNPLVNLLILQASSRISGLFLTGVTGAGKFCINVNGDTGNTTFVDECLFTSSANGINAGTSAGTHNSAIYNCRFFSMTESAVQTSDSTRVFWNGAHIEGAGKGLYTTGSSLVYAENLRIITSATIGVHHTSTAMLQLEDSDLDFATTSYQRDGGAGDVTFLNCIFDADTALDNVDFGSSPLGEIFGLFHDGISSSRINQTRLFNDFSVGSPNAGRQTYLGEGKPFYKDAVAYTYNGSSYAEDSARAFDGGGETGVFAFPNQTIGTAIYIGHPTMPFNGLTVLGSGENPASIYPGEIVAEYWNGAWTEFNCMATESEYPYQSYADNIFDRWTDTDLMRFDQNIMGDWVTTDDGGNLSTAYWVRFRIIATLASQPRFQHFRLINNSTWIDKAGFTQFIGNARPKGIINLDSFSLTSKENAGGDREVAIGSDAFSYKAIKNEFKSNEINQIIAIIPVPKDMDTSCPLKMRAQLTSRGTGNNDIIFNLYNATSKSGDSIYDSTGSAPASAPNQKMESITILGGATQFIAFEVEIEADVSEMNSNNAAGEIEFLWLTLEHDGVTDNFSQNLILVQWHLEYTKWNGGAA